MSLGYFFVVQHKFSFSVLPFFEGYASNEDETYLLHILVELTLTKTGSNYEFKDLNKKQILSENKLSLEPEAVLNKFFYKLNNQQ